MGGGQQVCGHPAHTYKMSEDSLMELRLIQDGLCDLQFLNNGRNIYRLTSLTLVEPF